MKLNALLMCRQHESLSALLSTLEELGIDEEMCSSAPEAMELLALGYYSALVVDFDLPGAAQVVHMARLAPAQRRPVVFAMIGARTESAAHFMQVPTSFCISLWSSSRCRTRCVLGGHSCVPTAGARPVRRRKRSST
jgi:hypothetical protein